MPTFRPLPTLLSVLLLLVATLSAPWALDSTPRPAPVPAPAWMLAPGAEQPIRLSHVEVCAEIAGGLATTRITLSLHNPNRRVLEGELHLPLHDGQTVESFALESPDGQMLPAAAVGKARGQEVFETIVRSGADPALLERTQGNHYKLRVYPLPAGGVRRVMLEISELLTVDASGHFRYRPPLALATVLADTARLNLQVRVLGVDAERLVLPTELAGAQVLTRHGDAWVLLERERFGDARQAAMPPIQWPARTQATVFSDRFEDARYFHADIPLPEQTQPRLVPQRLALVWDASGSGAERDQEREFALLTDYFRALGSVKVTLVVARDQAESPREFDIRDGDWSALRAVLRDLPYDGASNPAAWAPPAGQDLALLFSDGLGNWGGAATPPSTLPLYTLSAASGAHAESLRAMAEASPGAGRYLDLLRLDTASALAELQTLRPRLVTEDGDGVADIALPSVYPQDGVLRLAGRLTRPQATLNYALHWPDGRVQKQTLNIAAEPDATALISTLAARRWAGYRIAALEAAPDLHRGEIERLGKGFGLVTSQTSLLALESLDDYLRHQVLPPSGPWRVAYLQRQTGKEQQRTAERQQHMDTLAARFADFVAWWQTEHPKGPLPVAKPEKPTSRGTRSGRFDYSIQMPGEHVWQSESARLRESARSPVVATGSPPPMTSAAVASTGSGQPSDDASQPAAAQMAIHLQPWRPNAPYAQRLRQATAETRYAIYLDERPAYLDSPAFFLDAADIFFEQGQTALALRVLSNLAEMDLESRRILRVLAYRLLQAGEVKLALPLLRQVRDLAPEEPQSWRDLGLALERDGQLQAALEALWTVAARPWDRRFPDVELTALHELNTLLARHRGLDTRAIDPRLLRPLPVDLRVVLTWDADDTDIDLWVVDPNGEQTNYHRPASYQGGHLSRDFTGGYGPETYLLKAAKPGNYEIRAHFYGHRQQMLLPYTTLMARLTTGYGTPVQRDELVVLRLKQANDQVRVGSIEVGKVVGGN